MFQNVIFSLFHRKNILLEAWNEVKIMRNQVFGAGLDKNYALR